MPTQDDVRRICLALPEAGEVATRFAFHVLHRGKPKAFAWVWMERVDPKRARVPCPDVLAVRVASLDDRDALIELYPDRFFTEPHYRGYPAVLVRLGVIDEPMLSKLLVDAWCCRAAPALLRKFLAENPPAESTR